MRNAWRRWFGDKKNGKYGFPKGCIIIDVSFLNDYEQAHLSEAINIPLNIMAEMLDVLRGYSKTIVVVSNSNHTSTLAFNYLSKQGVKVFNGGDWTRFKKSYDYYKKANVEHISTLFTPPSDTTNNLS